MTFTTLIFLFFLALVFAIYWGLRRRVAQNWWLLIASYVFYGWWDWRFCGLMLAASLLDYGVGLGLNHSTNDRMRRVLLTLALSGNISLLGFFKYFNFFADNLRILASSIGWHLDGATLHLVLPVGISFYTFQTMSYSIDVYRRKLQATPRLIEYLAYVSFFPQLVAGPIERATHLLPQFFKDRVFDHDRAVDGCRQMLWGFFKKMVVADNLAPIVEAAFENPASQTGGELVVATVAFALQIYCDFSAYSDIAVGVARLFGFELMRNFAFPYFSQSMAEFWRRWHISLITWFKDYVYFPLGGSRQGTVRRALNVLITFLVSGLWHGASWNYVVWGLLNGLAILPGSFSSNRRALSATDTPGGERLLPDIRTIGRMVLTFSLVCVGWIFFRAKTLNDALLIIKQIAIDAPHLETYFLGLTKVEDQLAGWSIYPAVSLLLLAEWVQRRHPHPLYISHLPSLIRWAIYFSLSVVILFWGTFSSGQFIYFQF